MSDSELYQNLVKSFSRFVPQDFLELLNISDFSNIELGNQTEKKLTIMFSDIRGFTTLSEELGPKETFDFLNRYLDGMVTVIRSNDGFVDKYIGDAILALFPGDTNDALRASLAMLEELKKINQKKLTKKQKTIEIGIGLNTGIVILGTLGNQQRMETTVIGDAVNLASRLETLCKTYKVPLLISEHTLHDLDASFRSGIRFIDRTRVKGKFRPESVYEVFLHQAPEIIQAKQNSLESLEKGVAYYHLKAIKEAIPFFKICLSIYPDDEIALYYLNRCQSWLESGHFEGTGELEFNFQWKKEYNLGIPMIDQQHQQLLNQISKLLYTVHHEGKTNWEEILHFLEEYVHLHFQTEEALMEKYNYPFLNEHRYEHHCFTENYLNLRRELYSERHDRLYLLFKIDLFLVDWLINHTTKNDRHWAQFILQKGYAPTHIPDQA
ncbi:guanylate cyclase [bacterium (Candidatus Blackallbacteria) CG17_big_fil_post_rev_8_21_14_2_50_48_46]|uniref:Guanylate cyclase n=1 Tax=bacterium (Candidatus Blackallbacteria) CG17_big_fil_post_rev_8_21_14_2_50_48_46 TaxID=2014261 RepID=A0A2M7FXF4_9BACT|nr:MAG: guanylate cyclase [bacterium (Candidatus Blackallbacteria) CG18_big_fil_WC_8_21_14_2_50_49_26]PIW13904.1 MAG: guanylate cyclase [bacterium (Candidatus Blackallbacteria) CG17_big_fil_post_rev_8_21_14_2_50_48_46]PIW45130.1 MAG: guanylate cyclase [bacterium (Candidatus Blackallbacteria) CG13_big_fil_rev_8_21_14_2_50_49_14]